MNIFALGILPNPASPVSHIKGAFDLVNLTTRSAERQLHIYDMLLLAVGHPTHAAFSYSNVDNPHSRSPH